MWFKAQVSSLGVMGELQWRNVSPCWLITLLLFRAPPCNLSKCDQLLTSAGPDVRWGGDEHWHFKGSEDEKRGSGGANKRRSSFVLLWWELKREHAVLCRTTGPPPSYSHRRRAANANRLESFSECSGEEWLLGKTETMSQRWSVETSWYLRGLDLKLTKSNVLSEEKKKTKCMTE